MPLEPGSPAPTPTPAEDDRKLIALRWDVRVAVLRVRCIDWDPCVPDAESNDDESSVRCFSARCRAWSASVATWARLRCNALCIAKIGSPRLPWGADGVGVGCSDKRSKWCVSIVCLCACVGVPAYQSALVLIRHRGTQGA